MSGPNEIVFDHDEIVKRVASVKDLWPGTHAITGEGAAMIVEELLRHSPDQDGSTETGQVLVRRRWDGSLRFFVEVGALGYVEEP